MGGIMGGGAPAPVAPAPYVAPTPQRAKLPEDDTMAQQRRLQAAQSKGRASTLLGDAGSDTLG